MRAARVLQSPAYAMFEPLEPRLLLNATYNVPLAIPHDYSVDVTDQVQAFFDSVPDDSVIVFPVLGYDRDNVGYRIDGTLTIRNRYGLTIEGNNAHFRAVDPIDPVTQEVLAYDRDQWSVEGNSTDITLHQVVTIGAHPDAGAGGTYDPDREGQHAYQISGNVDGILLDAVEGYDTYGDGVYVGGGANDVTIRDGHFERFGRQGMAPCRGTNILIENNYIGDSRRGIIDIEPYAADWMVDNIRIIGNTLGSSRLLCFPMGGGGSYGSIYIADNIALGSNGTPKIAYSRATDDRRGPFICVNNQFAVGGSTAAGFTFSPVDAILFSGNSATFPLARAMTAVMIADSRGLILGNNQFADAVQVLSTDGASDPIWDWDNTTTPGAWASDLIVEELSDGIYVGRVPYDDGVVVGGQVIAIWRVVDGDDPITAYGLTTESDFAAVIVDAGEALVEGFTLDATATYQGELLPWLRPTLPGIEIQPQDQMVVETQIATFQLRPTSGTTPFSYQWQKDAGGGWANIIGATDPSYTTDPAILADDGALFRCIVTNQAGSVNSDSATLTVTAAAAPTIIAHPSNAAITEGWTATFGIEASGTDPKGYQWQSNDGGPWEDIDGAIMSLYTTPATTLADNGMQFRCTVTNAYGAATSNTATLTVTAPLVITEAWTGNDGDPWGPQWTIQPLGAVVMNDSIYSNHGRMNKGYSDPDGPGIAYINTATAVDVDATVEFMMTNYAGQGFGLLARGFDSDSNGSIDRYYHTQVRGGSYSSHTYTFGLWVSGDEQPLIATDKGPATLDVWYKMRFRVQANHDGTTTLQGKMWQLGEGEPDRWDFDVVRDDPEFRDVNGRFGLHYHMFKHREVWADNYVATAQWGGHNLLPTPIFTADPDHGNAPLSVEFDASDSYDADGVDEAIHLFRWDYGDSSDLAVSIFPTTSHQYTTPGEYTVTLSVNDEVGAVNQTQMLIDALPPEITSVVLNRGADQRSTIKELAMTFSEDVSASLVAADLTLYDETHSAPVNTGAATLSYNGGTNTATWDLSAVSLVDAYYTATLTAAGVTDGPGNELDGDGDGYGGDDYTHLFHRLGGDANNDADVNVGDLGILGANYDTSGNWWELLADLNADGNVNVGDLGILGAGYGNALAAPGGGSGSGVMGLSGSGYFAPTGETVTRNDGAPDVLRSGSPLAGLQSHPVKDMVRDGTGPATKNLSLPESSKGAFAAQVKTTISKDWASDDALTDLVDILRIS